MCCRDLLTPKYCAQALETARRQAAQTQSLRDLVGQISDLVKRNNASKVSLQESKHGDATTGAEFTGDSSRKTAQISETAGRRNA